MINVTRASLPDFNEYIAEILPLWDTHWITNMGEKHNEFKKELKEYLGVDNLELFVNGHMALEMVLQSMNLSGEVITTPFTFASTTHAIVRNGLTPVFCDIRKDTYTIDEDKIEELITDRTCAIVPVHVYGNVCNVEKIEELSRKYNLKVIYDAAHTFGELYKGKSVASFGDASILSFHATKVFHSIEGGAVCFRDRKLEHVLCNLKNFGIQGPEEVESVGANAKMNEFCAAMGLCNLRHIEDEIGRREVAVRLYRERLESVDGITCSPVQENVRCNNAYFPILVEADAYGMNRDGLYEKLRKNGICPRKYFYPLTSDYFCYKGRYNSDMTPIAQEISNKVLTLPLYASMDADTMNRVCNIIESR